MTVYESQHLEIPLHLKLILKGLDGLTQFGPDVPMLMQNHVSEMMRLTATSSISMAMSAIASSIKCPFGAPPADIQAAFDSTRKLHLECLHSSPKHCWDLSGNPRTC